MTDALNPVDTCRRVVRASDRATLATLLAATGEPYGSLVLIACAMDGSPLLLLSDLADHTRNLEADDRASLLLDGTAGLEDPLMGARVSLQGLIRRVEDDSLLQRYIRRHPSAVMYAGFKDFNLYRLKPERVHLVAGFGRIHWTDAEDLTLAGDTAALAASESEVVDHMNQDHSDAVGLYANRLLDLPSVGWRLTGVDPEGCDLRRSGRVARLDFDKPVHDAESARVELVRLVKRAQNPVAET